MNTVTKISCCKLVLICILILPILISGDWVYDDDGCRTPDRGIGNCILVKYCKPIMDYVRQSKDPLPVIKKKLKGYYCGISHNSVKVCCPKNPIGVKFNKENILVANNTYNHKNLSLLPQNCGQLAQNQIVGGNKTLLFEFPWMALLSYKTDNIREFKCAGTIINNLYVLTAAHCITNLPSNTKLFGVRIGEHNIDANIDCEKGLNNRLICADPVQDIAIAEVVPHPEFNATLLTNDIGLIRLAAPISFNKENVKPICLPITKTSNSNFKNEEFVVTGWGVTNTGKRSKELLKAYISTVDHYNCSRAYKKWPITIYHEKQICAGGNNNVDSCNGDSGGPLQKFVKYDDHIRLVQYGIVSFGSKRCGQDEKPGIYTRISFYMNWILRSIRS